MPEPTYPDSNSSRFSQQAQINSLDRRVTALEGGDAPSINDAWGVGVFNGPGDPRTNWHSFDPDFFDRLPTYQQQIRYLATTKFSGGGGGGDGVGVQDVRIDGSGHLIVTLTDGSVIDAGEARGADGTDGDDGKSAYQIAVDEGFVGTEQEWLDSLKGPEGPAGPLQPLWAGATGVTPTWGAYVERGSTTSGTVTGLTFSLSPRTQYENATGGYVEFTLTANWTGDGYPNFDIFIIPPSDPGAVLPYLEKPGRGPQLLDGLANNPYGYGWYLKVDGYTATKPLVVPMRVRYLKGS